MKNETTSNEQKSLSQEFQAGNESEQEKFADGTYARRRTPVRRKVLPAPKRPDHKPPVFWPIGKPSRYKKKKPR